MFFSAFGVPGTILNVLHVLTHLAHVKIWSGYIGMGWIMYPQNDMLKSWALNISTMTFLEIQYLQR